MGEIDRSLHAPLAILGGPKSFTIQAPPELFKWPVITPEDEAGVLEVLRAGSMSGSHISVEFEKEWGAYQGTPYNLTYCNGTAALLGALYGAGVGRGDEVIAPSLTYWASVMGVFNLGATVVFADIEPDTVCIDPRDIEHRITPRTKAIMVVHYCGHPCDMDPILAIAERHGLKVIEDNSHAHGSTYKGRMTGNIGHVSAMSMMAGKSFPVGEGGMLCTHDRLIYERALSFSHYERIQGAVTIPEVAAMQSSGPRFRSGLPLGGIKGRINQTCSATGRSQLKHYPARVQQIQAGMNRFWDLLAGTPGIKAHRPDPKRFPKSTMGGWYNPLGLFESAELGGLTLDRFLQAVTAEGINVGRAANFPLHLHAVLNTTDVYGDGKPTRLAFSDRDLRQPEGSLPVSEALRDRCFGVPWFKQDQPEIIAAYAACFRKVALQADKLLAAK